MDNTPEENNVDHAAPSLGRNEPCSCGSGKKYKRCHGVNAAPKLSIPSMGTGMSGMSGAMAGAGSAGGMPGGLPFDVNSLDPQWMMQFSQALQRLPAGQMQKLQAIMQKAMAGKDVTREAADFEKHLPPQFQSLLKSFKMPEGAAGAPGMGMPGGMPGFPAGMENPLAGMSPEEIQKQMASFMESSQAIEAESAPAMDENEAKKIVAAALAEGKISQEQAASVLGSGESNAAGGESGSKFSKLWKSVKGK